VDKTCKQMGQVQHKQIRRLLPQSSINVGLSGVRALPLAAGINIGGHYKWHFFLFLSFFFLPLSSGLLLILTDGIVVGF
jgi:hypothetical protein